MSATLRAGVAKANITPPVGYPHQGYAGMRAPCVGVHDDLFAKALFMQVGRKRLAIVTADVLGFSSQYVDEIKAALKKKTGLNRKDVIISASHTHYGPVISPFIHDKAPEPAYLSQLKRKIVRIVRQAAKGVREARLSHGKTSTNIGIINRRGRGCNKEPYPITPNPEGRIDDDLKILRVDVASQEEPLALLVNYACHPVSFPGLARQFSADYPGRMQYEVERFYNGKTMAMFTNGACGDINPDITDPEKKEFPPGVKEDTQRLGTLLALDAVRLAHSTHPIRRPSIAAYIQTAVFPFDAVDQDGLHEIKRMIRRDAKKGDSYQETLRSWWELCLERIRNGTVPKAVNADLHYINLGDEVVIAGLPGEPLVEMGLKIKCMFREKRTLIFGYSNGYVGYIPTARSLAEGCYEASRSYRYWGHPGPFKREVERAIYMFFKRHKP